MKTLPRAGRLVVRRDEAVPPFFFYFPRNNIAGGGGRLAGEPKTESSRGHRPLWSEALQMGWGSGRTSIE